MSKLFLKFKQKVKKARILKSVLAGLASGGLTGGIALLLSRLALLPFPPIIALAIGFGVGLVTAILFFLFLRTSDKQLAESLDERFVLQEKVQTMIAYETEQGELLDLQRQSAEDALSKISTKKFKIKRLWIYLTALCIGIGAVAGAFLTPDKRNQTPPPKPFAITQMQIAGIEELIRYVDGSTMEEVYRVQISASLSGLLTDLKSATTEPEMQVALTEAMASISTCTYDSSSSAEILTALWASEDTYAKGFATLLNTSTWKEPNWGDFAEKLTEYKQLFRYQPAEGEPTPDATELVEILTQKLDFSVLKINVALQQSRIAQTDSLYITVAQFVTQQQEIAKNAASYEAALTSIDKALDDASQTTYGVISQLKINTNVGEYTMTKLATLFPVPLPPFERPDLTEQNNQGAGEDRPNDKGPSDGGIGEGATFGSKDLVLDPLTGNYVEYGTLINKYYAVMNDRLNNGNYSDEQKELIKKYFSLLYSGIEKEDGK